MTFPMLSTASTSSLMKSTSESSGHGILTPQSAVSEPQSGTESTLPPLASPDCSSADADALNLIYRHAPDDKLLEALASSKDRLFLLRLEKDVIDFVQNSTEPYMDLPPSNSFCRMLTHKLADYYHMTHSFEPNVGSVRIFRTPFCRVPTSLAEFDPPPNAPSTSSEPPPVLRPMKIMRRGQEVDSGAPSSAPSKATSEADSDLKDKEKANQKLTREEREEAYKLARERIFGSSEDVSIDNDTDAGMSRASSVSGHKSTTSSMPRGRTSRQRRDDSDSFDSRHHYTPYWGPAPTWVQTPTGQMTGPPQGMPQPYGQQNYGQPQMLPGMMMPNNGGYPMQPMPQQRYPTGPVPTGPIAQYPPQMPHGPPQQPQQTWPQPGFSQPPYQGRGPPPQAGGLQMPYAFGQLPSNINPHDPKSQHPIPGSYSRHHSFNPMTQSFVPGGLPPTDVQAQPPFTAPGSHHSSPRIGAQHVAYPGYPQQMAPHMGGGYGMVRQASSSSAPGYHTGHMMSPQPQHYPPHAPPPPHQVPLQHMQPNIPVQLPHRPNMAAQGHNHMFTHLPKYGNPATLPQKPATGI